jgi:hypothetical protein
MPRMEKRSNQVPNVELKEELGSKDVEIEGNIGEEEDGNVTRTFKIC